MAQLPQPDDRRELLKSALVRIGQLEGQLAALEERRQDPIAIVGLACRFPGGANNPDAFWELLRSGADGVREIPADRWNVEEYYDADPDAPGKTYSRCGGFLDRVDGFDSDFFGIAPREAALMDPQQRLLLEVTWESLEHAGISPAALKGSATGVFVGLTATDFSHMVAREGTHAITDAYIGSGVAPSVAAGRLSYTLGLQGPCLTVDTACSSSLVAMHLACQSLRNGECNIAIAGGVSLILSPDGHIIASKGRMLSPDGRCFTFDARANGYVRSEGCGMIVLKRLSDAHADGDTVLAVIRGSALNQDGRSSGLTAPNGLAQEDVMRRALEAAGVGPEDVAYIEAHGTGTSLGDPIEVEALGALHAARQPDNPLLIGSVKSNVGHLEAAAGIAGIIKMVLAIQHRELPPHLHFQKPNDHIAWGALPVKVAAQRMPWPSGHKTMLAGVSSFGFSGTNAHVILEEHSAPQQTPGEEPRRTAVLPLSAKNDAALRSMAGDYARLLRAENAPALQDLCFTASAGRSHHEMRLGITAEDAGSMATRLEAFASETALSAPRGLPVRRAVRPVFVFGGQGSQYPGIARELFDGEPVFRKALLYCDEILKPLLADPLLEVLYPAKLSSAAAEEIMRRTEFAQPVLFAVEYALTQLWKSWGVEPAAVIGHSIGEYVAACVAGVFSLEDGLRLIAERGRLMQNLPPGGAMASVMADPDRVAAAIQKSGSVSIAAINGPANVVISGAEDAIRRCVQALEAEGVATRALSVSHAFHSALLEPALAAFERTVSQVSMAAPQLELISNLTGKSYDTFRAVDSQYWRRHARETVRFSEGIQTLRSGGHSLYLEVAPTASLARMGRSSASPESNELWLSTLRKDAGDTSTMLETLAALYARGVQIDWPGFYQGRAVGKVLLPTYPFQRTSFSLPQPAPAAQTPTMRPGGHPLLGSPLRSPRLSGTAFQAYLDEAHPGFLKDHRIGGRAILPASAYLEMAASAAARMWGEGAHQVHDLSIREPLTFEEGARLVQVLVAQGEEPSFEICSTGGSDDEDSPWLIHAQGTLRRGQPTGKRQVTRRPTPAQHDSDAYYETLRLAGAEYGPTFRLLTAIQSGEGNAAAVIPGGPVADGAFLLHPAILDAAFQLVGIALSTLPGSSGDLYMPVQVERYHIAGRPQGALQVYTAVRDEERTAQRFRCDVIIEDAGGEVARIEGLTFARAHTHKAAAQAAVRDSVLTMEWQVVETLPTTEPPVGDGLWLLFDDDSSWAMELGRSVATGKRVLHVRCGSAYRAPEGDVAIVRPNEPEDLRRLLDETGTVAGVIHLWNLANPAPATCAGLLGVVQAILQSGQETAPRLTVVTRGAQGVTQEELRIAVEQAASWGFVRALSVEEPALRATIVDLDPQETIERQLDVLAQHARAVEPAEQQLALRAGRVYAPRLVRKGESSPFSRRLPAPETGSYALEIASRGVLDQLELKPFVLEAPGAGEVQIEIAASGLNFRDVLNALGMYSGKPGPLGNECVGTISMVGEGVTGYACGDRVMALTPRGFCSYVNTAADLVWRLPASMSLLQAATIPLVFQTAYYALVHVAGLKRGDRVLIHAAAGGVGLAAVQIAQSIGAEVFATAGSPTKRALLADMGVAHVMSSRTLDFAEQIHEATGGEGVHVVLNSLAGDFIPRSLGVVAEGGWFLELGSSAVLTAEAVSQQWPKVRYEAVFLGNVCVTNPEEIRSMYGELMQRFEAGTLRPLPLVVFPIDRVQQAFRFMAQARHTGKIVVTSRVNPEPASLRGDATYLITGGFGALGLHTARWMAAQGARRMVLLGRRGPSPEAMETISELRAGGVEVLAQQADVSDRDALARILQESSSDTAPLRGVVHAAGTLDDALIRHQTGARFANVFGPKAMGALHLDALTREADLDFFVLYSAGAAILGSPGQSNYAAANAVLDSLAADRRAAGLPATTINWGPWAGGGMASRVSQRDRDRWTARGIRMIDPVLGMAALEQILTQDTVQAAVLPLDWQAISQAPPMLQTAAPSRLQERQPAQESALDLAAQLSAADPDDRTELVRAFVRQQVACVLGFEAIQRRDDDRGFTDLGLDSLTAVELSNRLGRAVGQKLPATITFERPTVVALAEYLASRLAVSLQGRSDAADVESGEEEFDELSDEALELALAEELDKAGY